jgi:aminoglycoside phosphotransferase (APT) family kinase protein
MQLTCSQAQQIIELQQWKNFKVDSIQLLDQGVDNLAFLVNQNLIFRFPKHDESDLLLQDENKILPALQRRFDLHIPNPIYFGKPTGQYPYHFHGYLMLKGIAWYQTSLTQNQLQQCAIDLAQFLKKLHAISVKQALRMGAQVHSKGKTVFDIVSSSFFERTVTLKKYNVAVLDDKFHKQIIEMASRIRLDRAQDCLMHGDLDMRHLLIVDQKLSGVIDWGDVAINHPVVDFMVVYNIFPLQLQELFWQHYGPVSDDGKNYARFLTLHRMITLMKNAHEVKNNEIFVAALNVYDRLKKEI